MHFFTPMRESARLILISLFPECIKYSAICTDNSDMHNHYKMYYTVVTEKKIPSYLQDPELSEQPVESVKLYFPNTFMLAAPFLLFRMKRRGFSASRVTVQNGGLLLTALR
ncbi:MAG: hypothetical protein WCA04_14825 [Geobacteraceae bacterium]